jgi:hypothetical protein
VLHFKQTAVAFIVAAFFFGYPKFGDDIRLTAPDITTKELAKVTQLTGIQFPEGTVGLGYLYLGSGIDDALTLKIKIPNDQKGVFLENEIFKNGDKSKHSIQIAATNRGGNWINSKNEPTETWSCQKDDTWPAQSAGRTASGLPTSLGCPHNQALGQALVLGARVF